MKIKLHPDSSQKCLHVIVDDSEPILYYKTGGTDKNRLWSAYYDKDPLRHELESKDKTEILSFLYKHRKTIKSIEI